MQDIKDKLTHEHLGIAETSMDDIMPLVYFSRGPGSNLDGDTVLTKDDFDECLLVKLKLKVFQRKDYVNKDKIVALQYIVNINSL